MVKQKLLAVLTGKCKDMGLSEKSIEEIAGVASNGLKDGSTDEEIEAHANLYFPVLKSMQGEATRWAQAKQTPPTPPNPLTPPNPNEDGGLRKEFDEFKNLFTTYKTESENTIKTLQTQLQSKERETVISAEMAKLGLNASDMEFVSVPSDANVPEFLGKYKQSLVNRGLKPTDPNVSKETKDKASSDFADALLSQHTVEQK